MRTTLRRTLSVVLAVALLVSCAVSGLVMPALADDGSLYFENGIISIPARFDSEYDILSQLKAEEGYTIDSANLTWSIENNATTRYYLNSNPFGGSSFTPVTMEGSTVKMEACTTSASLSSQNKSGNWVFARVTPTITVTDGTNTATAQVQWVYDTVPIFYDFENDQKLQHSASHTMNNYITQDTEGNYALRLPTNERVPTRAFFYTSWAPNSVYKISFKYKNEGEGTGTRQLSIVDGYDLAMSPSTLKTDAATTGWQTVEATITTGASPTINYNYSFLFDRGTTSTNYVWMDDIKVELVSFPATSIVVKPETPTMTKGSAKQFSVVALPENASSGTITWSVSDETLASVDAETGIVTALADAGTVEVIATSSYGPTAKTVVTLAPEKVADPNVVFEADFENGKGGLSSHWKPVVKDDEDYLIVEDAANAANHALQIKPVGGRYFAFAERELKAGRTYKLSFKAKGAKLSVYVAGGQATPGGWHDFTADDADVWQSFELYLTIPDFMIHPDRNYIFALRNRADGVVYVDDMELRLVDADPAAESIEFDYTRLNMKPGAIRELQILSTPEDCDLSELVWASSNEDVVYVTPGKITAVGTGTATVTATTNNGKMATAEITVTGHETFIPDATFEDATTSWMFSGDAAKESDNGYAYTTMAKLPIGSSISHTIKGLKSDTSYKLIVMQALPNNTAVTKVTLKNGDTVVYEEMLGKTQRWTQYTLEFTTGTITGDCTLTFENTSASDKNVVHLDNVVLAEVVSDVDPDVVVSSDFEDKLSDKWSEFNKKDDQYALIIKDPADPMNHVLELQPFYNADKVEVSGRWFKNIDNLIPGRTYKVSFKVKGPGVDLYFQPDIFAKRATLASVGWVHVKPADSETWYTYEELFTVDPQAIHIDQHYVFAIKNQQNATTLLDDFEVRLVEAEAPVESIQFDKTEITLAPGRTQSVRLVAKPDVSDLSGLVWTSSNEQVAYVVPGQVSVTGAGKQAQIVAVGAGEATVTVTANNGKAATCTVVVNGHDALLDDITLNDTASTAWTLENGAAKATEKGFYYTPVAHLPMGGTMSQAVTGLKTNARYQLSLQTRFVDTGANNVVTVKLVSADGSETLLSDVTTQKLAWTANKYEFATGETVADSYKLVITNETTKAKNEVYIDNVILAEAVSDVDLIISDFFWDNDENLSAQVKPGTPLTFTVAVVNQGQEAMRSTTFDVDILIDAKKVQTISYTGALAINELVILTGEAPWAATEGDHMVTAHVNASMKVLENDESNNDMTYNLRVYDDVLTAPEGALKRGFNKLTFSDDFNSLDTIDVLASGNQGYHWYVTRLYGETDQVHGRDFTVKDGVLTLHSIESSWAHSISTTDTRKKSGFVYNKGYLEARIRLPHTSQDLDSLRSKVRNPGIWAFSAETMWGLDKDVAIETDWLEFKGTKYRYPADKQYSCRFDIVLHHREDFDGNGTQDYWAAQGSEFYYRDGYVVSGPTADDLGEWHTMGWAWSENMIEVYLDGRLIHTKTYSEDGFPTPGAHSNTDGVPLREGTFSALNNQYNNIILGGCDEFRMEVDYIRVWQADGTITPEEPANPVVESFMNDYMTDKNGEWITEVTADTYEQIIEAQVAFVQLSETTQQTIDAAIDFSGMVVKAQNYKAVGTNFAAFFAAAEDGTPYTVVDESNYEWIAGSEQEWNGFDDVQRAIIDDIVFKQCGMTFTAMLAKAKAYVSGGGVPVTPPATGVAFPSVAMIGLLVGGAVLTGSRKRNKK